MDFYSGGTIDINATKEFTIRHYMHFPTITAAYHMNLSDQKEMQQHSFQHTFYSLILEQFLQIRLLFLQLEIKHVAHRQNILH